MSWLGIDTAQVNLGLALLSRDAEGTIFLRHSEVLKPQNEDFREADFLRNRFISNYLETFITKNLVHIAAMESAALGYHHGMYTIGTVHGIIVDTLMRMNIPFLYVTPNKLKYFAAGPAKGGPHGKMPIIKAVREIYPNCPRESNHADACVLATIAVTADIANWAIQDKNNWQTPWDKAWAHKIFADPTKSKNNKAAGIFLRENEFYWRGNQWPNKPKTTTAKPTG